MKIGKRMYIVSTITIYLLILMSWLMCYIFLGEDIELNTRGDYIDFMKFTLAYLLTLGAYLLLTKHEAIITAISAIGVTITPLLIWGYLGVATVHLDGLTLHTVRQQTLFLHILVYGLGTIKTYRIHKKDLWAKT